jgi:hypothetical protein
MVVSWVRVSLAVSVSAVSIQSQPSHFRPNGIAVPFSARTSATGNVVAGTSAKPGRLALRRFSALERLPLPLWGEKPACGVPCGAGRTMVFP